MIYENRVRNVGMNVKSLYKIVKEDILPKHTCSIKPKESNIYSKKQIQHSFPGFSDEMNTKDKVKLGTFYELLTSGLFGGSLADIFTLVGFQDNNTLKIHPDVLDTKRKNIRESKAIVTGGHLTLFDGQINRYSWYQSMYPEFKTFFVVWRHNLKKRMNNYVSYIEVFKELANKTIYGAVIPFSLIFAMHASKDQDIIRRFELDTWEHCTTVKSQFLNLFIFNPEEAIKKLEFSCSDFIIKRLVTPDNMTMEGLKLDKIPIIVIDHVTYADWVQNEIMHTQEDVPF